MTLNFRGNVSQGRMLKEISYQPSDIESREPLFQNGPYKVRIKGQYHVLYEDLGYEFLTAREAVNFWIEHKIRYFRECSDFLPLEKFTRLRTRAEKEVNVQRVLDGIKTAFIPQIASALSREGVWNEVLYASSFEIDGHEENAANDLKERLTSAAGGELLLLILATVFPDLIKAAVNGLPEGQTPEQHEAEQRESAERSKVFMANQIRQAQEFLKKLGRDE